MKPGPMMDGDLPHPGAFHLYQCRQEAMHAVEGRDAEEKLGPVGLEPAVHVVEMNARDGARHHAATRGGRVVHRNHHLR